MSAILRGLGAAVALLGVGIGLVAGWFFATDAAYHEVAAAYARHPAHALFQAEYWAASLRHWGLMVAAAGGVAAGLVFGALLLGVGEVLRRLPRRPRQGRTKKAGWAGGPPGSSFVRGGGVRPGA